jgi:hypothetical protein
MPEAAEARRNEGLGFVDDDFLHEEIRVPFSLHLSPSGNSREWKVPMRSLTASMIALAAMLQFGRPLMRLRGFSSVFGFSS